MQDGATRESTLRLLWLAKGDRLGWRFNPDQHLQAEWQKPSDAQAKFLVHIPGDGPQMTNGCHVSGFIGNHLASRGAEDQHP